MKTLVALLLLSLPFAGATLAGDSDEIVVYKSPTCGCCTGWVKYLEKNGFKVKAHNTDQLNEVREKLGLSDRRLMSCHTAVVDGYVVEGHVPADDIKRLLSERPDIAGITAPGMPQLSPGMHSETPKGYDVLSFDANGNIEVYSSY